VLNDKILRLGAADEFDSIFVEGFLEDYCGGGDRWYFWWYL
jgi:hypothetical protein